MLNKLRIKGILITSSLTFAAVLLFVAGAFLLSVERLNNSLLDITDNTVPSVVMLSDISVDTNALMVKMGSHVLAPTTAETLVIDEEIALKINKIEARFAKYALLLSDERDRALFNEARAHWTTLTSAIADLRRRSIAIHTEAATDIYNRRAIPAMNDVLKAVEADRTYNTHLMDQQTTQSDAV